MLFSLGGWLMPFVFLATGIWLLSGSVVNLLEASLIGVGTFLLGMKAHAIFMGSLQREAARTMKQMMGAEMYEQMRRAQTPVPPSSGPPPAEPGPHV